MGLESVGVIVGLYAIVAIGTIIAALVQYYRQSEYQITVVEMLIVNGFNIVLIPLFVYVSFETAINDLTKFNEKLNANLTGYSVVQTNCSLNGPCIHEYRCNPHQCNCRNECMSRDAKGNCTSTMWKCDTCYDNCPYCNKEYTYVLHSDLPSFLANPDFVIADHWLPENPQSDRWRGSHSDSRGIPGGIGSGIPSFWQMQKQRLDNGISDSVTANHEYENFLQVADNSILREYSNKIDYYRGLELLPQFRSPVYEHFHANKAYFVGFTPENSQAWQESVANINALVGPELHGDLYVVIVRSDVVAGNPREYLIALKAYWQDREIFKRDTLAKNAILVLVGTEDGSTVSYVDATTGMPGGNEAMIIALQSGLFLLGEPLQLTPELVIGSPRRFLTGNPNGNQTEVHWEHSTGYIENIIFGLTRSDVAFGRVSMSADDVEDEGLGYEYLRSEIKLETSQLVLIWFLGLLFGVVEVAIVLYADIAPFDFDRFR